MSRFWKVFLVLSSAIVLMIILFCIWLYMSFFDIESLDVTKNDSNVEKVEKLDKWLGELHENKKFNGAVLLIKNDKVFLKEAYGYTDCSKSNQLTIDSMFRLASVSKQFTAAGIMLLHEKGQLNFDDAIINHIPDFPFKEVTIRHLLNQTSGIPDVYMGYPEKFPEEVGDVLTIQKMLEIFIKHPPENSSRPNEQYEYSNTNYVLLAALIEKITNLSYEDYMKTQLFNPLGMESTRVWNLVSKDKTFSNKAQDFDNYAKECQDLTPGILDGVAGDGAVFSSIDDFVIWNQFWYENHLISESTMKEAFKEPILNDGTSSDYGFGWIVSKSETMHNGSWLGANTLISRDIKNKNCIVLLDNSSNYDEIQKMEYQLMKVFD